ncbi:NAD(P)-dependent oxidoreductase, partial [Actinomadura logoneensis]
AVVRRCHRPGRRSIAWPSSGTGTKSSDAEAVAGRDLVISMLTDAAAVHEVLLGADLAPGTLVAEMSTIGPDALRELAGRLPDGVRLVDAPVLGSVPHAEAGELVIVAGGRDEDVADAAEALGALGTVRHVGPSGRGAAAKLVVNSGLVAAFGAVAEAVDLAVRLGVNRDTALELLGRALPQADRTRTRRPDAPVTFTAGLADKDLALALDVLGPDARVLTAARTHTAAAVARGLGGSDITVLVPTPAPTSTKENS